MVLLRITPDLHKRLLGAELIHKKSSLAAPSVLPLREFALIKANLCIPFTQK